MAIHQFFPPSDFKQLDRKIERKKKGKGIFSEKDPFHYFLDTNKI